MYLSTLKKCVDAGRPEVWTQSNGRPQAHALKEAEARTLPGRAARAPTPWTQVDRTRTRRPFPEVHAAPPGGIKSLETSCPMTEYGLRFLLDQNSVKKVPCYPSGSKIRQIRPKFAPYSADRPVSAR